MCYWVKVVFEDRFEIRKVLSNTARSAVEYIRAKYAHDESFRDASLTISPGLEKGGCE